MSSMTDASALARKRLDSSRSGDTGPRPDSELHQAASSTHEEAMKPVAEFLEVLRAGDHPDAKSRAKAARIESKAVRLGQELVTKRHMLDDIQKVKDHVVRTAFYLVIEQASDFDEALSITARVVVEAKAAGDPFNGPLLRQLLREYYKPSPQTSQAAMDQHDEFRKSYGFHDPEGAK